MSDQKEPNNPAGRLHAILGVAARTSGGSIRHVYSRLLDIEEAKLGEILRMLGILSSEADEVHLLLGTLDNPMYSEKYVQCLAGIKRCFEVDSFSAPWDAFKAQNVKPEYVMALGFCSIALEERIREKTISADVLKGWLDRITKLAEEVKTSDIDGSLKALILSSLERIRAGIREYKVRGIRAIREAVVDTIGSVTPEMDATIQDEVEREKRDDKKSAPVVREWLSVAADIAQIVLLGMALSPLFAPALQPLLPGR